VILPLACADSLPVASDDRRFPVSPKRRRGGALAAAGRRRPGAWQGSHRAGRCGGFLRARDLRRRPSGDEAARHITGLGPQGEDPVWLQNDVEVGLDQGPAGRGRGKQAVRTCSSFSTSAWADPRGTYSAHTERASVSAAAVGDVVAHLRGIGASLMSWSSPPKAWAGLFRA